jgi:pantoate--beta-alanine ligase
VLWLGQKDAQQARIIERMVEDLQLPVRVRRGSTVREADGLALSSRNRYLSPRQRTDAVGLYVGLEEVRRRLHAGERSSARLIASVRRVWKRFPLLREDYVAVVDADTMQAVKKVSGRVLVAVAARVGRARLIDNFEWESR